jgi:hypothetical protein
LLECEIVRISARVFVKPFEARCNFYIVAGGVYKSVAVYRSRSLRNWDGSRDATKWVEYTIRAIILLEALSEGFKLRVLDMKL